MTSLSSYMAIYGNLNPVSSYTDEQITAMMIDTFTLEIFMINRVTGFVDKIKKIDEITDTGGKDNQEMYDVLLRQVKNSIVEYFSDGNYAKELAAFESARLETFVHSIINPDIFYKMEPIDEIPK